MNIIEITAMNMLRGMVGNLPDYKVRQYALRFYELEYICAANVAEIEAALSPVGSEGGEE